jgi:hypothetical protein
MAVKGERWSIELIQRVIKLTEEGDKNACHNCAVISQVTRSVFDWTQFQIGEMVNSVNIPRKK